MLIPRAASFFRSFTILKAVDESRPLVGSSRNSKEGLVISSYPIDILFRSPPETPLRNHPPILVSWQAYSANFLITCCTLSSIKDYERFNLILHAKTNSSFAVSDSDKTSSCCTKAAILPKSPLSKHRPLIFTAPFEKEPPLED